MKLVSFDSIVNEHATGYAVNLVNRRRFAPREVTSSGDFNRCIDILTAKVAEVVSALDNTSKGSRRGPVTGVYIGKTTVGRRKNARVLDPDNVHSWKYANLGQRARAHRQDKHADHTVALVCFVRSDVPPALAVHGMDQEVLGLAYEKALDKACRKHATLGMLRGVNRDEGGGGRTAGSAAGCVLYVALVHPHMPCEDPAGDEEAHIGQPPPETKESGRTMLSGDC